MKQIYSYLPETELFLDKNNQSRICHFDCAVLDAKQQFEVLAERGFHAAYGENLFSLLGWQEEAYTALNRFLPSSVSTLLRPCAGGSLLLFRQWYDSLGLLLAIRLPYAESELRKELNNASHSAISPIFSMDDTVDKNQKRDTAEALAEVFYYTERIFALPNPSSLFGHALLLANFAGCRLLPSALPYSFPQMDKKEAMRLSAFLLCTLLSLRKAEGNAFAFSEHSAQKEVCNVENVQPENPPTFSLSVKQILPFADLKEASGFRPLGKNQAIPVFANAEVTDKMPTNSADYTNQFPFLTSPTFQDVSLQKTEDSFCLTAHFTKKQTLLRAGNRYDLTYCFIFGKILAS